MAKAADIVGLDCEARAQAGITLVLRTRLEEMCSYRAAALDESDTEGVHDMRVASRRLRSAMADFAPYLHGRLPRKRLRQLARALGVVRDEDVAQRLLEKMALEVEADMGKGFRAIRLMRRERRDDAHALLALALEESALEALQQKFLRKLAAATATDDEKQAHSAEPPLSFKQMGREIIGARLTDLIARGGALYQPNDVERLHRLRIAAKRLRYALELFTPCLGAELHDAAAEVARLQKALGDLHDCDVWVDSLGSLLEQTRVRKDELIVETATTLTHERKAMFQLLHYFTQERTKHFHDALDCWTDWEAKSFFTQLRELS
jgi:CHAD domain-containing protein